MYQESFVPLFRRTELKRKLFGEQSGQVCDHASLLAKDDFVYIRQLVFWEPFALHYVSQV